MPVRAKDIKGFILEEKYITLSNRFTAEGVERRGFNEAIAQMSNRSLGLNREKLLLIIKEAYSDYQHGRVSPDKSGSEHIVNEIISQKHNLLESKDKNNLTQEERIGDEI